MSIVDKVRQMLGRHHDKAGDAIEKAGDMFDEKTGGKYADTVDKAQERAQTFVEDQCRGDRPST